MAKSLRNLPLQCSDMVVAVSNGFAEAEIDGEIVALSIERGTCYGMNRVGSQIWKLLKEPVRICELQATLLTMYRVDPELCERQLIDLLEELREEGLISVEEK